MEADDLEGIAVIILIRFTSRREEMAKTGAEEQIAAQILEVKPNFAAEE
jgi:hypothetical protein